LDSLCSLDKKFLSYSFRCLLATSLIKETVGATPLGYLTTWRMQKAATLLQKGDNKVVDVAKSVGYDSGATFSKAFKRVVHVTPSEFRRGF
jgi:AraC-like DNA-binding protein